METPSNKIQWYVQDKLIYNELKGDISLESIAKGSEVIQGMIDNLEHPIDIIFDASQVTTAPTHIGHLTTVTEKLFENKMISHVIVITDKAIQRFIGNVILQIFRKDSKIVANLDEALQTLQRLNPKLGDLPKAAPNINIITVD